MHNPDPKKYVVRRRKGREILVDRQILRYEKRKEKMRKQAEKEALRADQSATHTKKILGSMFD